MGALGLLNRRRLLNRPPGSWSCGLGLPSGPASHISAGVMPAAGGPGAPAVRAVPAAASAHVITWPAWPKSVGGMCPGLTAGRQAWPRPRRACRTRPASRRAEGRTGAGRSRCGEGGADGGGYGSYHAPELRDCRRCEHTARGRPASHGAGPGLRQGPHRPAGQRPARSAPRRPSCWTRTSSQGAVRRHGRCGMPRGPLARTGHCLVHRLRPSRGIALDLKLGGIKVSGRHLVLVIDVPA